MRKFFFLLILAVMAVPVWAQGIDCNALVQDQAGVLGAGLSQVTTAAQDLVNAGADVRVLTVRSFAPQGNLDQYQAARQRSCASWQSADGGRKNNLIVFVVAVGDRKVGLYYGEEWRTALDAKWSGILSNRVTPRFRDGDYSGGISNGLSEVARSIRAQSQPIQAPAPVVVEREPVDLSGLWAVLRWALLLGLVIFGTIFLTPILRTRKKEWEVRRGAQAAARSAKAACTSAILEFSDEFMTLTRARLNTLEAGVAKSDVVVAQNLFRALEKSVTEGASRYADLSHSSNDPDRILALPEYGQIEEMFKGVGRVLAKARERRGELEAELTILETSLARGEDLLATAKLSLTQVVQTIAEVQKQGFKARGATGHYDAAKANLEAAEEAFRAKRVKDASVILREVEHGVHLALDEVRSEPQKKASLERESDGMKQRIGVVTGQITAGREAFEQVAAEYAPTTWRTVRGNGTEAEKRVEVANAVLGRVTGLLTEQDWELAGTILKGANTALDEAESFMRSIVALRENLTIAKRDAPNEIQAAEKDVQTAWEFIRRHDEDVAENLETRLRRAEKSIEEAKTGLMQDKPDFLAVLNLAKEANAEADAILDAARNEHEQAERLRQKALSAVRNATAAVSAVKEYIEDHRADVRDATKRLANEAGRLLSQAQGAAGLNERVRLATEGASQAEKALETAQAEVDAAEDRRRPAVVYSSPGSSYGSWGSRSSRSSSGGSTDFGSSSGGGGSVDFGGGGGGGGGSTGW